MNRKKMLVIDDDLSLLNIFQIVLGTEFEITTASNGAEGLKKISPDLDLVLVDYNMPGINGFEFIECLLFRYPKMPVVVMSGILYIEEQVNRIGAKGFVPKPCLDYSKTLKSFLPMMNQVIMMGANK